MTVGAVTVVALSRYAVAAPGGGQWDILAENVTKYIQVNHDSDGPGSCRDESQSKGH